VSTIRVRTPTDFRQTMRGAGDFVIHEWVEPSPEAEPAYRQMVEAIFNDLSYISADDPGLVSAYLEGLAEPLRDLDALGLQLMALPTRGTIEIQGVAGPARMPWSRTHYVIAPAWAAFRGQRGFVHLLGTACGEGEQEIAA